MLEATSNHRAMRHFRTRGRKRAPRPGTFSHVTLEAASWPLLELVGERSVWVDGHYIWRGALTKTGHPAVYIDGKQVRLHRLIMGVQGEDHTTRVVGTCPYKTCVNPEHLRISRRA